MIIFKFQSLFNYKSGLSLQLERRWTTLARVEGESAVISAARPMPGHNSAGRREAGRAEGTGGGDAAGPDDGEVAKR